ncbi:MAG: polyribonucleotide nucleotidyltransferase [Candidatus Omnitrophota bacterium]
MTVRVSRKIGEKELVVETGKMAKQADGAVTLELGGTVILTTCVCSKEAREGIDFLPLTSEYREKTYAAGKIPGGFFKREGRPSEKEILTARLVDRPIRPLFPEGMVNDIQVFTMVLSSDGENDSDVLAVNSASAALSISNIPFDGPVGCVRVGLIDGKLVINPTFQELEGSDLDLVVVGREKKTLMIEAGANELSEEKIEEAVEFAKKYIEMIIDMQKEMVKKCGRKKREDIIIREAGSELLEKVKVMATAKLNEINKLTSREEREEGLNVLTKELAGKLVSEDSAVEEWQVKIAISTIEKEVVREQILESEKRVDGRSYEDIRAIDCSVGILPRTHGSGLFTRGQTQALCVTTLGTSADEQRIDALEGETQKSFMLHYNFPSFSVGEVKPIRGPGRREIGHGALAEKALRAVMPSSEEFPYTVRVVSDILESNGSSSMASVCAGSLCLMDAGVPTKAPVAGIAIGLVTESEKHILLTDIAGLEDHYGDMDCKVAGTKKGVTTVQLDLKIKGIEKDILHKALAMARKARLDILEKMADAISQPKDHISDYAPRIVNLKVSPDKIKDIIGPGGRIIKKIIKDFGVSVDVEDDGSVQVASSDDEATKKAIAVIKGLTAEVEVGKVYSGKITRLMNFGAFCEILPGKEGLIHVSQITNRFVKDVASELKVGDEVKVKVVEIDQQGRVNLSRKAAMEIEGEEDKDTGEEKRGR